MNDELDEFIQTRMAPRTIDNVEVWEPDDDDDADWAMMVLADANRELARIQAAANDRRNLIDHWADTASAGPADTVRRFTEKLVNYRRRLEADHPKMRKTYPLPSGDIYRRAGGMSVRITDPDALTAWAVENAPDLVGPPSKQSIKDAADIRPQVPIDDVRKGPMPIGGVCVPLVHRTTGELIPGVEYYVGPDTYGARPSSP